MGGRKKVNKETGLNKEELQKVIAWNQEKLDKIEQVEKYAAMNKLVGNCFRYRNSYAHPEKPSDFWWVYAKVTDQDKNGNIIIFEFQTDCNGEIRIFPTESAYKPDHFRWWKKITNKQLKKQWLKVKSRLLSMEPELGS